MDWPLTLRLEDLFKALQSGDMTLDAETAEFCMRVASTIPATIPTREAMGYFVWRPWRKANTQSPLTTKDRTCFSQVLVWISC